MHFALHPEIVRVPRRTKVGVWSSSAVLEVKQHLDEVDVSEGHGLVDVLSLADVLLVRRYPFLDVGVVDGVAVCHAFVEGETRRGGPFGAL